MTTSKQTNYKRLSDAMPSTSNLRRANLDDVLDQDLIIHDVEERRGDYGEYVALHLEDPLDHEEFVVMTGAMVVKKKLIKAQAMGLLPLMIQLTKRGRYYDVI